MKLIKTKKRWKETTDMFGYGHKYYSINEYYEHGRKRIINYAQSNDDKFKWLQSESWHHDENWNRDLPPREISVAFYYSSKLLKAYAVPSAADLSGPASFNPPIPLQPPVPLIRDARCLTHVRWSLNGELHRDQGPAVIEYDDHRSKNDSAYPEFYVSRRVWCQHGVIFRENNFPVIVEYDYLGNVEKCVWWLSNSHKDNQDYYCVTYHKDGSISMIDSPRRPLWYPDGPNAMYFTDKDGYGNEECDIWKGEASISASLRLNALMPHRENGPAIIKY